MIMEKGKSPLRISILSAFYPFRGGIAQFNGRLFKELRSHSEINAFTFTSQYPSFLFPGKSQLVGPEDNTEQIPAQRIVNPFNPFTWWSASRKIKVSGPNVFISNFWVSFFGPCFGFLSSRQGSSAIRIGLIHNLIPHEPRFFDKWFTQYYLRKHNAFIVLSEAVERDLLALKPDAKYIRLFHPWYDHFGEPIDRLEACRKLGISSDRITLLFFGLIREYKGVDLLIEAFGKLPDNYQLVIAGEVYEKEKDYQGLIKRSAGAERIFFHDRYISDTEVSLYFSAATVCVLPYRTATQSGVTALAYHFEIPVLATDVGDLKRTIEAVSGGLVVSVPDPDEIVKGIIRLTEEDFLNRSIQGIRGGKDQYSWEKFSSELLRFLDELRATHLS
jgi:glycosyltransferase involved in cell wall biosynthesis